MPKKSLGAIFPDLPDEQSRIEISDVTADSREVTPGAAFFAMPGAKHDGAAFIAEALKRGAAAVVVPRNTAPKGVPSGTPLIFADDIRNDFSRACSALFDHPSRALTCLGVTGTNGKTSVSWLLAHSLRVLGRRSSLCGTLGYAVPIDTEGEFRSLANTTPDPRLVQEFLSRAQGPHGSAAVFEATSQGIVQGRTAHVEWDGAVFTNLTRDHLDLHGSMEDYAAAKLRLFTDELARSTKSRFAVTNLDDELGRTIYETLKKSAPQIRTFGYSNSGSGEMVAEEPLCSMDRTAFRFKTPHGVIPIESRLVGAFNVANLLAAAASLVALGYSLEEVRRALSEAPPVPGRLEVIGAPGFHAVVDYAHTPDALVQAQRSLRPLTRGRLITVFGCGGDRDRGKRPLMGRAVAELADVGIVTSDNPRTEEPEAIIADIVPGISGSASRAGFRHMTEPDRRRAIARALEEAGPGDVILIAGKGHEDYQEIRGVRYPFSDQQICRELLG